MSGKLVLSDGRPASNAAVFLGDDRPNKTALDMGSTYYYTSYANEDGEFEFKDVRAATYGFQAWSNGSTIADVSTSFLLNGVVVDKTTTATSKTDLGTLEWEVSNKTKLFQIGDFDRHSYGFQYGGAPHQHALVAKCPADLVYTVGESTTSDWCFGQTYQGNWTVRFNIDSNSTIASRSSTVSSRSSTNATLIVSLAGYSSGTSSKIWANDVLVGNLTSGVVGTNATTGLVSDPCLYRSGTGAGEWRYFEFGFDAGLLAPGWNKVWFEVTRNNTWHGFMWDSVILEY